MAVYTEINGEQLADFVAQYDLGAVLSFKGITEGVENSNYLLVTERGPFILTLYEKRVDPADLPFFLGLMNHLAANGQKCPIAIKDKQGEVLGSLAERPAAIISFLQGMSVRRPRPEHCSAVGGALAQLHLSASGFSPRRANRLSLKGWEELAKRNHSGADRVATGLAAEIDRELRFLEENWPSDLPQGVIHADLFPDNVFFLAGDLSGVIDFYFACNDLLAYDIAICLNAWCFEPDNSFNVTNAQALLRGYSNVRRLEKHEVDCLPILARGAALRFLLTRLSDWRSVPHGALVVPKDPLEYYSKLRFHRRVDSAEAYGLAR